MLSSDRTRCWRYPIRPVTPFRATWMTLRVMSHPFGIGGRRGPGPHAGAGVVVRQVGKVLSKIGWPGKLGQPPARRGGDEDAQCQTPARTFAGGLRASRFRMSLTLRVSR